MKTAVISSLFLAGVALAVPSKRAGEPVTFTSLDATLSDYTGSVQVSFTDPNYDVSTSASLTWNRPGEPPADTWSDDNNYLLSFPSGVDNIDVLSFVIKRSGATETVTVTLDASGNGSAWTCGTINGVPGTRRCYAANEFSIPVSTA